MMATVWKAVLLAGLALGKSQPLYSPARPPAVPLAVRGPYTSTWSSTAKNATLNSADPIFWDGTSIGWEGFVAVDGIAYEYLGSARSGLPPTNFIKQANQTRLDYDSSYSNFTFMAGPVQLNVDFLSTVYPQDICRTSIPLSYLTVSATSMDGGSHNVQLYNDINGAWISKESNATLQWDLFNNGQNVTTSSGSNSNSNVFSWIVALEKQYTFGELFNFPLWGKLTFNTMTNGHKMSYQAGNALAVRWNWISNRTLTNTIDRSFRGWGQGSPVYAFAHDLGSISGTESVTYTVGSVQDPAIRYLDNSGVQGLHPYWQHCYGNDLFNLISTHFNDLSQSAALAAEFESKLKADVNSYYAAEGAMVYSKGGESRGPMFDQFNGTDQTYTNNQQVQEYFTFNPFNGYGFLNSNNFSNIPIPDVTESQAYYSIVALSARQVMGAYTLTTGATDACTGQNSSGPLMFQREISSGANVNTVDVLYPAMPFFLYANPDMIKYQLDPLFQNQENNFYPNMYSMHDLGTHYPNATGHVEGNDEYMPVEESGNMILLSQAYTLFKGDSSYISMHYAKLKQFSEYLINFSLLPGVQLSTDDFAGSLANQTNLAIKGIVGLAAMSKIASATGHNSDAQNFTEIANSYFTRWEGFGIDPSGKHSILGYEWRSSWSLLYNIMPAKLLGLSIIPQRIYDMQSEWYPQVAQLFGVPLDNRHDYTKSDWEMWCASIASPSTRMMFVNALGYWLNNTNTNTPFSDLYQTTEMGGYPEDPLVKFIARPVVGGHYALLAMDMSAKLNQS